jgi:hypothetical protein
MKYTIQGEFVNNIENFNDKTGNCMKERCNKIDNKDQCLGIVNGVQACTWDLYSNPKCVENPMLHSMSSNMVGCSCTTLTTEQACNGHDGCTWDGTSCS